MNFYLRWKFSFFLAVLLSVFAARLATIDLGKSELVVDLLSATVVVAAILSICEERRFRRAVLILGIPAVVFLIGSHLVPGGLSRTTLVLGRISTGIFLCFTVALIVRTVLTQARVSADTIVGAICGYLLIGVLWTDIYCALEVASPGSFSTSNSSPDDFADPDRRHATLEYFSFVTLTTVGYGDIFPVARAARALAVVEAIAGQFYLAVLVAGLVSLHVNTMSDRK